MGLELASEQLALRKERCVFTAAVVRTGLLPTPDAIGGGVAAAEPGS